MRLLSISVENKSSQEYLKREKLKIKELLLKYFFVMKESANKTTTGCYCVRSYSIYPYYIFGLHLFPFSFLVLPKATNIATCAICTLEDSRIKGKVKNNHRETQDRRAPSELLPGQECYVL